MQPLKFSVKSNSMINFNHHLYDLIPDRKGDDWEVGLRAVLSNPFCCLVEPAAAVATFGSRST